MISVVWLIAAAILNLLILRFISRSRGVVGSSALPAWIRVLAAVGSLVASGAVTWWLFDLSGFFESQRLAATGDYAAAIAAWRPLVSPDSASYVLIPLTLLGTVGIGIHMALRPAFWATATSGGKQLPEGTLPRFRVYGYVIAALSLAASLLIVVALLQQ